MKGFFNGNVYEMPQGFSDHIIINRIITEIEDPEHIPFFVKDSNNNVRFMFGRKIQEMEKEDNV